MTSAFAIFAHDDENRRRHRRPADGKRREDPSPARPSPTARPGKPSRAGRRKRTKANLNRFRSSTGRIFPSSSAAAKHLAPILGKRASPP
jgi:hypothetical protein